MIPPVVASERGTAQTVDVARRQRGCSQIPASARNAIRKAVQAVKDEVLVYNGSVCDAVWSASAGYNTQTGVYGTCASLDAWGTDVPYLQSDPEKP